MEETLKLTLLCGDVLKVVFKRDEGNRTEGVTLEQALRWGLGVDWELSTLVLTTMVAAGLTVPMPVPVLAATVGSVLLSVGMECTSASSPPT